MTPTSLAAIALLRHAADRLEKGEIIVCSLINHLVMDPPGSDPYATVPIRTRLEIMTCTAPPSKTNG